MRKFLSQADKMLDVLLRWGALFTAIWAGLTFVAKQLTGLKEANWADAAALGLLAAILVSLTLSAMLIAWRYFHPLQSEENTEPVPVDEANPLDDIEPFDDSKIWIAIAELAGNLKGVEQSNARLMEEQHLARLEKAGQQFADFHQQIEKLKADIKKEIDRGPMPSRGWVFLTEKLQWAEQGLVGLRDRVSKLTGVTPDFNQFPNFTRNPAAISPPGIEVIGDEVLANEYRRIYDQLQTAQKTLSALNSRLAREAQSLSQRLEADQKKLLQ